MSRKGWTAIAVLFTVVSVLVAGGGMVLLASFGSSNNNASASACTNNASVALAPSAVSLGSSTTPLTADQLSNASTIVGVASSRGLGVQDALVALIVAFQESGMRNLPYGDRDSLGLFQQRPSQGWGTPEQILNPVYAANKFFDALVAVPNRDSLTLIDEAIAVQRPSRAAYEKSFYSWQPVAEQLLGNNYQPSDPSITPQLVAFDTACPAGGTDSATTEVAIQAAISQIGKPYVWGGESETNGFDCSGLMQFAWNVAGVKIPRVAAAQYDTVGSTHINDPSQLQRGDLVFWTESGSTDAKDISHVAMYLGNNQIIAAPHTGTLVQIEPMYFTHYFGATRIVQPTATVVSSTLSYQLPVDSGSYTLGGVYGGNVYIMGDSITERAQAQYRAAFQAVGMTVTIDASASRSLTGPGIDGNRLSGLQALAQDKKAGLIQNAVVVVIAVGSNGVDTPQGIDTAISTIRQGPNANTTANIWLIDAITVGRNDAYNQSVIKPSNLAIYGEAKPQGYGVIPWFNTVDPAGKPTQPSNLETDSKGYIDNSDGLGVHPTPAGIAALVNLVVGTVGSGSSTTGVDFIAPAKTPVKAIGDGSVISVRTDPVLGIVVTINYQGGVQTQYAHLGGITAGLVPGGVVTKGTTIGSVGASGAGAGNRLSFSVTVNGQPTDPIQFLRQAGLRP